MKHLLSTRLKSASLVVALAAAGLIGTPSAAQAAGANCLYFRSASGCATSSTIWVNDKASDGYSAVIRFRSDRNLPALSLWDRNGAGNGRTVSRDYPNSNRYVQLCKGVYKTKKVFSCSGWYTA